MKKQIRKEFYVYKKDFYLNDFFVGKRGTLLCIADTVPANVEEDDGGYCDVINIETSVIFEARWEFIEFSALTKKMDFSEVTEDILLAISSKSLSEKAEKFLIHWLSEEEKTDEDRKILDELAHSKAFQYTGTNLFRGCHTLRDGCTQSYSTSIREAARFAGEDGIVVAVDTSRACVKTFDLSKYLWTLLEGVINGDEEGNYSERLLELVESCSGEDEVLVTTKEDCSMVFKVYQLGEWL